MHYRGLGKEYDGVYDPMCIGIDMRGRWIGIGALSDHEMFALLRFEVSRRFPKTAIGHIKVARAAKNPESLGDVVGLIANMPIRGQFILRPTLKPPRNRRQFNAPVFPRAALSAETNFAVREKIHWKNSETENMALINADLFTKVRHVPACDVVIMARPTASVG